MSRTIPFAQIPDSTIFPDGIFHLKIDKAEETMTKEKEGRVQKVMFRVVSKVVAPAEYRGLLFFENFVVGTDDDPEAELLETWQTSIGGRSLKKLAKATGVALGDEEDSDGFLATIKGQEYLATIVQKVDDGSKDPKYKGQVRNNATAYWKLGEKAPALTNGAAKPAPAAARTARPAEAKAPASDELTCTGCKKRVPRKDMKAHVEQHMKEFQDGTEATE